MSVLSLSLSLLHVVAGEQCTDGKFSSLVLLRPTFFLYSSRVQVVPYTCFMLISYNLLYVCYGLAYTCDRRSGRNEMKSSNARENKNKKLQVLVFMLCWSNYKYNINMDGSHQCNKIKSI